MFQLFFANRIFSLEQQISKQKVTVYKASSVPPDTSDISSSEFCVFISWCKLDSHQQDGSEASLASSHEVK